MLNQKGQEFSVFKLLISAIVAIVVLTLLLNILGIVDFNPNTDPAEAAKNLLTSVDNSNFQEKISDRIDFTSENSINSKALSDATGLSENQICLLVSEELTDRGFTSNGKLITYANNSSIRVKLAGICAEASDFRENDFLSSYTKTMAEEVPADLGDCSFVSESDSTGRACLMVLIRSNE